MHTSHAYVSACGFYKLDVWLCGVRGGAGTCVRMKVCARKDGVCVPDTSVHYESCGWLVCFWGMCVCDGCSCGAGVRGEGVPGVGVSHWLQAGVGNTVHRCHRPVVVPCTGSISTAWELARNAKSQVSAQTH